MQGPAQAPGLVRFYGLAARRPGAAGAASAALPTKILTLVIN